MPELLPHESETHELLVLVTIADDEVVGRLGDTKDRLELRLAAALQTDAMRFAELQNLLDDVSLLIHLDRIHGRVSTGVAELGAQHRQSVVERPLGCLRCIVPVTLLSHIRSVA